MDQLNLSLPERYEADFQAAGFGYGYRDLTKTDPTSCFLVGAHDGLHLISELQTPVLKAFRIRCTIICVWFNEAFGGVVLAYDVQIQDKVAKILPGLHPYFSVRLKAKLLLFAPKPKMLLEGKVVRLTETSIHVIVLGFSSAVITDEDIREELKYKMKHSKELYASRSHKHHVIKVGTMIRFLVKR
ncbi:putative DNA-directed RNA polymerase I subunit RPA43 [Morella rubra]|uniref:DNA-directed RNA polymerase subunit n=1 Tax=Morella rubra TaxID=262757 RepID=A0A6A1UX91_9ROSI|nr:putative DNA-directed RNA polymerase I subunit RPA43 [Morella rubra]